MSGMSFGKVLAITAAFAVGAIARFPGGAAAGESPFQAAWTGNAHLSETKKPWIQRNDETGAGEATHLGGFTWASVESVNFKDFPPQVSVVATFTMTASDGDELFGEYTTVGLANDEGNLDILGVFFFTGGTGRFAGATGGGLLQAIAFFAPGLPFEGEFCGTIDY
jgi:hypothetical protein